MCSDMKIISILQVIFIVLLFLVSPSCSYAESYNEETCFKDYITEKDKDTVIAVNRDTNAVELYWSETGKEWKKPDEEMQKGLQKQYNRKLQLLEMQSRMDRMNRDTLYTTNMGDIGRR